MTRLGIGVVGAGSIGIRGALAHLSLEDVLYALTGILGPAKSVVALSGIAIRQREFEGSLHECDADDNSLLLLDFGASVFAFVHGTFAGSLTRLGEVNVYGSEGTVEGELHNDAPLEYPSERRLPHVTDAHGALEEAHVFEDVMQLVDWVRDDIPSVCDADHARHVIEIIEAAYRSAETRRAQDLETTF